MKTEEWGRLEAVIKWAGMSANAFARELGLKRSETLYQIRRGNNRISRSLAENIANTFPDISCAWLLTGEGEMIATDPRERASLAYCKTECHLPCVRRESGECERLNEFYEHYNSTQ